MNFADYLPNIFGYAPAGVEGLLGAERTAELNKQANVSGLLGAAMGLAAGMSPGGYRRSAAQNILGAIGAGVGASQGQYQGAIDSMVQQSQMAKAQAEAMQQYQKAQAIEMMARQYPQFAHIIRVDPQKGYELAMQAAEEAKIAEAYRGTPNSLISPQNEAPSAMPVGVPQAGGSEVPQVPGQEKPMPPVEVTATRPPADRSKMLLAEKEQLLGILSNLSRLPSKRAMEQAKNIDERIKNIDSQLDKYTPGNTDLAPYKKMLPPEGVARLEIYENFALNNRISAKDYATGVDGILKDYNLNTSEIKEYKYAQSQGYKGTFVEFQRDNRAASAPKLAVNTADPTAVARAAMDVSKDYQAVTKNDREIRTRYDQLISAYNNPSLGGTGDAAMIYSVAKILDPEGAVREGDVSMIAGNRTYPDQLRAIANKFISNQRLTQQERDQLMSLGYEIVAKKHKNVEATTKQYRGYANDFNVRNPEDQIRNPYDGYSKPQFRVIRFNGKEVRAQLSPKDGRYYVESGGKYYPVED